MITPLSRSLTLGSLICVMTGICAVEAVAQSRPAKTSMELRRDKKLESPFLKKANWITDYDKARAIAKKEKKLIFSYFTRSFLP